MSLCQRCQTRQPRPTTHAHLTKEAYRVLIAALRHVAYRHGYALAVHGSLRTDIDLIAVPWRESAVSPEPVAMAIKAAIEAIWGTVTERQKNPEQKPSGRLAWSFYLGPEGISVPYVDLSIFPPQRETRGQET